MQYILVENNSIIGVQSYEPNVPQSVSVTVITDEEYSKITKGTHYFDIANSRVVAQPQVELDKIKALEQNKIHQHFLHSTDWKVLRHIRQKALNMPTSLSDAEYLDLELERDRHANAIIH